MPRRSYSQEELDDDEEIEVASNHSSANDTDNNDEIDDAQVEMWLTTSHQMQKGMNIIFHGGKAMVKHMKPVAHDTFRASSMYLVWIVLHYTAGQLYGYYCAPSMFSGFFLSPFLVSAPHCKAIRWALYNGGNVIDSMWIVFATWLCSKIVVNI